MAQFPLILTCLMFLIGTIGKGMPHSSARSVKAIARVRPALSQALAQNGLYWGAPVFIRAFKREHQLELWVKGADRYELFRTYDICYFSGELGPKRREGDQQVPEGFYTVTAARLNPWSAFHLSFNIGYPNAYDRLLGRTGGLIMIHGNCVSTGCLAMTDEKIEEIYALVDAALRGKSAQVPVHVFPFRMTEQNLTEQADSPWLLFWRNLKQGYDLFETNGHPAIARASRAGYTFDTQP